MVFIFYFNVGRRSDSFSLLVGSGSLSNRNWIRCAQICQVSKFLPHLFFILHVLELSKLFLCLLLLLKAKFLFERLSFHGTWRVRSRDK